MTSFNEGPFCEMDKLKLGTEQLAKLLENFRVNLHNKA